MTERFITATVQLPSALTRRIGAFITRWGYLENHLQRTCYLLLGVTMEQGRLMVQEHRASDRPIRIGELAHLGNIKVDEKLIKSMSKKMMELVEVRDCLAHGVWFYSPDHREYALSFTKGSWPDASGVHSLFKKKKVKPEGLLLNSAALQSFCDDVDELIAGSKALHEAVLQQLSPSRDE